MSGTNDSDGGRRSNIDPQTGDSIRIPRESGGSLLLAAQDVLGRTVSADRSEPWSPEGFCRIDGRFAIITSQPFVAGTNATAVQIREWMEARNFTKLCDATWFREADGLGVFDVGGSNLFADESGELVPIDVIPVQAEGTLRAILQKAFERK